MNAVQLRVTRVWKLSEGSPLAETVDGAMGLLGCRRMEWSSKPDTRRAATAPFAETTELSRVGLVPWE